MVPSCVCVTVCVCVLCDLFRYEFAAALTGLVQSLNNSHIVFSVREFGMPCVLLSVHFYQKISFYK